MSTRVKIVIALFVCMKFSLSLPQAVMWLMERVKKKHQQGEFVKNKIEKRQKCI